MTRFLVLVLVLSSACTKRANECHADSDCAVPFPFCDVDGMYAASGGVTNVCTIVPPDCAPERCGCTPNATTCADQTLSVCNADGKSETTTACDLGCAPDNTRCASFTPSNGLGDALAMAANEPDIEFPQDVLVTDAGEIYAQPSNTPVIVKSILVAQVGVPAIRVYLARSFKIHNGIFQAVSPSMSNPIAFVSSGAIAVDGIFDAGFQIRFFGPGRQLSTAACAGEQRLHGGGGGGNATAGGDGAPPAQLPPGPGAPGGPAQPADLFEPLVGGCPGGGDGTNQGGSGGAALQFVSGVSINVTGTVNVGGTGGDPNSGGGSGGNILLEAPIVSVTGTITANGGSGGACEVSGNQGTLDLTPAASIGGCGTPSPTLSGAGGTATHAPGAGAATTVEVGSGGGGSVGRLEVKTVDGNYAHEGAVLSVKISAGSLTPR